MSATHLQEIVAALNSDDRERFRDALQAQLVRFLPDREDAADQASFIADDPRDANTGIVLPAVIFRGRIYEYVSDDETSVHDGLSTLVLAGQYRYRFGGSDLNITWVLSNVLTIAPDPDDVDEEARPQLGDSYLVPAGGSGAWATKADHIAIWLGDHDWGFVPPRFGLEVWVRGSISDTKWHYDSAGGVGEWRRGFGDNALTDAAIQPAHLNPVIRRDWIVESAALNAPPVSPSPTAAWIVGPSPTGAWAGQTNKIAQSLDGGATWIFETARLGDEAFNKAIGIPVRWTGTAWQSAAGAITRIQQSRMVTSGAVSQVGVGGYVYSPTVAPTTGWAHTLDQNTLQFAALQAGARLRIGYTGFGSYDADVSASLVIGLFVDNETNARDWKPITVGSNDWAVAEITFDVDIADTDLHEYKVRWFWQANDSTAILTRRRITIAELADLQPMYTDL